jgi:hypothetical protein
MKFIVTTEESVRGTYEVEADSETEAASRFAGRGIDWQGVEQVNYEAYMVELDSLKAVVS